MGLVAYWFATSCAWPETIPLAVVSLPNAACAREPIDVRRSVDASANVGDRGGEIGSTGCAQWVRGFTARVARSGWT